MTKNMNKVLFNAIINNANKSNTGRMNAVIPVEMIDVDPTYQRVTGRNGDKLRKLKNEWDYNLMDALMVVPHKETNNFFVVDGLGRLTIAKEIGLEQIDCVILDGPDDPEERRKFEAKYFLKQAACTDPLRPMVTHNAKVIIGDETAMFIDKLCKKAGVEIMNVGGSRKAKKLGSYSRTTKVADAYGFDVLAWTFEVIKAAAFDEEKDGYSGRLVTVLGKFFDSYRETSAKELGEFLRPMTPMTFQARAIAKYPERSHNPEIPMILFLQDWAVEKGMPANFNVLTGKKIA